MKKQNTSKTKSKSDTKIILALEASANQLSIAVMVDGAIVSTRQHLAAHGHAVGIVPSSIDAVNAAGVSFEAITHVAAGCGPGSFTGIRVTLAAAKGFCMAYQAVGVGLSGLQALAMAASSADPTATTPFLTLADTRRNTLYAQLFDTSLQPLGPIIEAVPAQLPYLLETNFCKKGLRLLGIGREAVKAELTAAGVISFQPKIDDMPDATMIAFLAAKLIQRGDVAPLEPIYFADPRLGNKKKP